MKIRNPKVIQGIGVVGSKLIDRWMGTMTYHTRYRDPEINPAIANRSGQRYVYAFFHETLLFPAKYWNWPSMHILISEHADGEIITQIVKRLGIGVVRGSSTRGGVKALLKFQGMKEGHLCITPDGPRGPRRKVHPGMVYLASSTGLPVVCAGLAYSHCWRAKSWDRFAVPKPYSHAVGVGTRAIHVPQDLDREGLEHYRALVEREMNDVQDEADAWAEQFRD